MKNILKYIVTFILMIVVFCVLLTITSLIPRESLTKKVKESSTILCNQGNSLIIFIDGRPTKFDNYTDSLMINTAYSIDNTTPFYSSMVARKNYIKGKTEVVYPDTTGELKSSSKYKALNQVGDLRDTVNNDTVESFEYSRYWHGYLIFLRPLLVLFNISQIRAILTVIYVILAAILLYKIYKKINLGTAIIFLCGLMICDYFYLGITLQGTPVFLITMISSILILSEKIKDKGLFFLIIGGLTNFFDFLTVPILTLGIPLLVYSLIQNKNKFNIKKLFIELFKCCVMWAIGYGGVWITKWLLLDLFYNKDIIQTVLEQFKYRSSNEITQKELLNSIKFALKPISISFIITLVLLIIKLIKYKKSNNLKDMKFNFKEISVYLSIGLLAVLWILLLKQHFVQHIFFTYRNMALISISVFLIIYNLFTKKEYSEDEEKINGK